MAKVLLLAVKDDGAIGIRIIGAHLLNNGHKVLVILFDMKSRPSLQERRDKAFSPYQWWAMLDNFEINIKLLSQKVNEFKPDIIGLSARSIFDEQAPRMLEELRKISPNSMIICGGYGPTFNYQAYIPWADFVVRGEGEDAVLKLSQAIDSGSGLEYMRSMPNLVFQESGKTIVNPLARPVFSFDENGMPLIYDCVAAIADGRIVDEPIYGDGTYPILIGRGCLGKCTYCAGGNWREMYAREGFLIPKRRCRKVDDVIDELKIIKSRHTSVRITDEHLAMPLPELLYFFDEYKKHINLPFSCYLHCKQVVNHPEIIAYAVNAGMRFTAIGIQSGDEIFCKEVYDRPNNNDDILRFAQLLNLYSCPVQYQFITASPLEDEYSFLKNIQFMKRLNPTEGSDLSCAWFYIQPAARYVNMYPLLAKMHVPQKIYSRYSALLQLRAFADDDFFEAIYEDAIFKHHPEFLQPIVQDRRRVFYASYKMHREVYPLRDSVAFSLFKTLAVWGQGQFYDQNIEPFVNAFGLRSKIKYIVDENMQTINYVDMKLFDISHLKLDPVDGIIIGVDDSATVLNKLHDMGLDIPCFGYSKTCQIEQDTSITTAQLKV